MTLLFVVPAVSSGWINEHFCILAFGGQARGMHRWLLQVKPVWGQRLKRLVPKAVYFEISPAGHCPHDEAPAAVNHCMKDWIMSVEDSTEPSLAIGSELTIRSKVGTSTPHCSGTDLLAT